METVEYMIDRYYCTEKDGFVFTSISSPANVFDAIVIRNPIECDCFSPKKGKSNRSLKEHIEYVNRNNITKALIVAEDIGFITQCPTLENIQIIPADTSVSAFDYSPLYKLPRIKMLQCGMSYGPLEQEIDNAIDYSKISGVKGLKIAGNGHLNYNVINTLEEFFVSNVNDIEHIGQVSNSEKLKKLTILQCAVKTLNGIEKFENLQSLCLWHNRGLVDLSEVRKVRESLRLLSIEACPKIVDFSWLSELHNLEHLELKGSNLLPNLSFLQGMKKLKTFSFSMVVQDGDLIHCLEIPYVNCMKTRKWYNMKDRDLPKNVPTEPFRLN